MPEPLTWEGHKEKIEGGIQAVNCRWYKETVVCIICGTEVKHNPTPLGYSCCGMEMDVEEWLRLMALVKGPASTDVAIASMKQEIEQHIHETDWAQAVHAAKNTIEALENLLIEYTRYIRNAAQESRVQTQRADELDTLARTTNDLALELTRAKDKALKEAIRAIEAGNIGDGKHFEPRFRRDFLNMLKRAVGDL